VHLLLDYKSLVRLSLSKKSAEFFIALSFASAVACFSSTGRYEIKCHGKKLVGSAQRRYAAAHGEEVVLQHGSILIGVSTKQMVDYLNLPSEEQRVALKRELDERQRSCRRF